MTKGEACRAISERLEPNAHSRVDSDFEWWGQLWSNGERSLLPLDYFESEDASARLLDMMASENALGATRYTAEETEVEVYWPGKNEAVNELEPKHGYHRALMAHRDRKTAIVLAFMKWNGIEGEISG